MRSNGVTLTTDDIKLIKSVVHDEVFELRQEIKEEISHLPSKKEFFEQMNRVCDELSTIRPEQITMAHQIGDLQTRVSNLETAII